MSIETDGIPLIWEPVGDYYYEYELFVLGAQVEAPSIESLAPEEYALAVEASAFIDWKYKKGLSKAEHRDYDPGFLQSTSRVAWLAELEAS